MQLIFIGHTIKFSGDNALRLIFHHFFIFSFIKIAFKWALERRKKLSLMDKIRHANCMSWKQGLQNGLPCEKTVIVFNSERHLKNWDPLDKNWGMNIIFCWKRRKLNWIKLNKYWGMNNIFCWKGRKLNWRKCCLPISATAVIAIAFHKLVSLSKCSQLAAFRWLEITSRLLS